MTRIALLHGDCIAAMRMLPDASIDSVVTDPPYSLSFMGKAWDSHDDYQGWCQQWATEALRVLKPGGHLLAFGGTRTWHRLACAIEDAGFEVRDSIAWLYGQGFPKSLDVSKAIDRAAGAEREVVGLHPTPATPRVGTFNASFGEATLTAPATPDATTWQGWGTALKPAFEPIVVARKPLIGTVAANVLAHGTGALNIDGCRVAHASDADLMASQAKNPGRDDFVTSGVYGAHRPQQVVNTDGRWPANVILDGSQADALDAQSGTRKSSGIYEGDGSTHPGNPTIDFGNNTGRPARGADVGGASRFFYVAKAPTRERITVDGIGHPTVKPLALMWDRVRLVTPPGGTVLDPFAGTGTTGEAAALEGLHCIMAENGEDHGVTFDRFIAARMQRAGIGLEVRAVRP